MRRPPTTSGSSSVTKHLPEAWESNGVGERVNAREGSRQGVGTGAPRAMRGAKGRTDSRKAVAPRNRGRTDDMDGRVRKATQAHVPARQS